MFVLVLFFTRIFFGKVVGDKRQRVCYFSVIKEHHSCPWAVTDIVTKAKPHSLGIPQDYSSGKQQLSAIFSIKKNTKTFLCRWVSE